ncbi:hypothetical protein EDD22DRAFT_952902 [Suillus occidentalis]|nr:hypothetical protein EDD22DRAFT_952902 [Suillus occidentalis]
MSSIPSSTGYSVKPLDIELQNGSGIGNSLGDKSAHPFSLRRVVVALIFCAGFGATGTFCCMIVGHSILQPYINGFYVSIHSTAKVGAVGGAIINGLLLPIMISFAASQPTVTSRVYLVLLAVGLPTTIASGYVGVVLLLHIPGGTLDIPHAVYAATVGYTVLTSPIILVSRLFCNPGVQWRAFIIGPQPTTSIWVMIDDQQGATIEAAFILPNELIAIVFDELDVVSLLRCKQVCRLFHSVITTNVQLLYKVELFFGRFENGRHCNLDTVGRLRVCRQYQQAWNNLSFPDSQFINMEDGHTWELSGGVLCHAMQSRSAIACVQLPCKIKNIPERKWIIDDLGFRIRDFTIDTSQNLVVALEISGAIPNWTCNLHFRTLMTGKHHPMAAVPSVTHLLSNMHEELRFLIQICGSRIAFLCQEHADDVNSRLVVWDWKLGQQKLTFDLFLSSQKTCFWSASSTRRMTEMPPRLDIVSINSFSKEMKEYKDVSYICGLEYPKMKASVLDMLIRSEPTPGWSPSQTVETPFFFARSDRIFTITLRVTVDHNSTEECTVLIVPLSTIMAQVESSGGTQKRNVPWKEWGPNGSHIFLRTPSEVWVCHVYGMKFIQLLPWNKGKFARVYDFNRYAARRDVCNEQTTEPKIQWKRLGMPQSLNVRCSTFDEKVNTYLPGRVANIEVIPNGDSHDWEAAMISEDNIIVISVLVTDFSMSPTWDNCLVI